MARCARIGDGWRDERRGRGAAGQELGRSWAGAGARASPHHGTGDGENRVAPGNGDFKLGTTLGNIYVEIIYFHVYLMKIKQW